MPNGATPSGNQKTGFVQKRYELKFLTGGQPDHLEWEDVKVTARVRKPGNQEPIPIKQVTKLEDDSDHVLQLPDPSMIPTGGEMIEFNVGINRDALDRVKPKLTSDPQGPVYHLDLEVDADPNLKAAMSTAMGAAMQMAPGGMGGMVTGAVLGSMKVSGSSEVAVEFPHPFIWHQLMDERFEYAGKDPEGIDTADENGLQVGLHLREFSAKGGGYQPGEERLDVKKEGDGLGLLEDIVVDSKGVTLKARRVLIGKLDDVQAPKNRIKLIPTWTPPPGSTKKPARNQGKINARPPEFQFKAHTVDVTIEVFHIKENETEPVLIQTIENQTLDGERVLVDCNGLPADFKGFLRWKVKKKPNRYTADIFHMEMEEPLISKGSHVSATIELVQQGCKTDGTPLNLPVQIPLQQQYLNIQISKNGWRTPEALSISARDTAYADFFKTLDQGGGTLTFKVPHDLKERFEDIDVPDTVLYPEVTVTGLSGLDETVTCDDQGLVTCRFGAGSPGSDLDISDRIPPLQIDAATLEPLRKLEEQAGSTGEALKTFEPRVITVMKEGQKDLRREYLKDYILLPGTEKEGEPNISSTAKAREAALLSLSLMIDACGDTPDLYQSCEKNYTLAFRNAVTCTFTALIDGVLFLASVVKSKDLLKYAANKKILTAEAGGEVLERGAAGEADEAAQAGAEAAEQATRSGTDAAGEGAEEAAQAGTSDAAEEGADQAAQNEARAAAQAGAETTEEAAEDLSKLTPVELEKRLAENKAKKEATEKAIQEIKESHPNIEREIDTLKGAVEETDNAYKTAKELKEGAEEELDKVTEAFEKSAQAEKAAQKADEKIYRYVDKCSALDAQKKELTNLVEESKKQLRSLESQADEAKEAVESLAKRQRELDKAIEPAQEKARNLALELENAEKDIQELALDMKEFGESGELAKMDQARRMLNTAKSNSYDLKKKLLQREKDLDSLKNQLTEVTEELSTNREIIEKAPGKIREAESALASLEGELQEVTKDNHLMGEVLLRADKQQKELAEEASKLRPSSELGSEKDILKNKADELAADLERKKGLLEERKMLLEQAEKRGKDLESKESTLSSLKNEEGLLQKAAEESKKHIAEDRVKSTLKSDGSKTTVNWVHSTYYGIPGIGSILFLIDHWEDIWKLAASAVNTVMNMIGAVLVKIEGDVADFSKRLQEALGEKQIKVKIQPVYGPKESWVIDYMPRANDTYLDPLNRANASTQSKKKVYQEARANRLTLENQVKNNILASLGDAFESACAYKALETKGLLTLKTYTLGEHQVTGAENFLRKLVIDENYSQALSNWNPVTLFTATTWNDYVRILDWLRFIASWGVRVIAVLGAFGTIMTGYGPVVFALMFLAADGIDAFVNSIRAAMAALYDSEKKAMYLQLAANYPCLAQAWIFKGMTAFSPQDLEAINMAWGLENFHPPDATELKARLELIKKQIDDANDGSTNG